MSKIQILKISTIILLVLNAYDLMITSYLLNNGAVEANPRFEHFNTTGISVFDSIFKIFISFTFVGLSFSLFRCFPLEQKAKSLVLFITVSLTLFYTYVAINNTYVLVRIFITYCNSLFP